MNVTSSITAIMSGMPCPPTAFGSAEGTCRRKMPSSRTSTATAWPLACHITRTWELFVWRSAFAHASETAISRSSTSIDGSPTSAP